MIMTKATILDFLRSHKDEMHEKFGLIKIGLFGSYVRGEQREDSDIDLAVEIESSNKFRSFFGLKAYLEDGLQKKIDLGIESSIKPIVHKYIEKEIEYA